MSFSKYEKNAQADSSSFICLIKTKLIKRVNRLYINDVNDANGRTGNISIPNKRILYKTNIIGEKIIRNISFNIPST